MRWYNWQKDYGIVSHEVYNESLKKFFENFKITNNFWTKEKYVEILESKDGKYDDWKRELHTAVDYASHYEADEKILSMAERRWDMFHTLSATEISLGLGWLFGLIIRAVYQFLFVGTLKINLYNSLTQVQIGALIIIILLTLILLCMFEKQKKWLLTISAHLHKTRIINSKLKEPNWSNIFPELFREDPFTKKSSES